MKTIVVIFALLLLFSSIDCRRRRPKGSQKNPKNWETDAKDYEYNALVLSWYGEFCEKDGFCKPGWEDGTLWNGKRFTIHGLWPQERGGYSGRDWACAGQESPFLIPNLSIEELFSDDPAIVEELRVWWP